MDDLWWFTKYGGLSENAATPNLIVNRDVPCKKKKQRCGLNHQFSDNCTNGSYSQILAAWQRPLIPVCGTVDEKPSHKYVNFIDSRPLFLDGTWWDNSQPTDFVMKRKCTCDGHGRRHVSMFPLCFHEMFSWKPEGKPLWFTLRGWKHVSTLSVATACHILSSCINSASHQGPKKHPGLTFWQSPMIENWIIIQHDTGMMMMWIGKPKKYFISFYPHFGT